MFEVSKAEMIETIALSRKSGEFGKFENGKVILENGDVFEVRSNAFGWTVTDCKTKVKHSDIELMEAIHMVLDQNYMEAENIREYEAFESGRA